MNHRNARLVFASLLLIDFALFVIQMIVWKIPTFIEYLNVQAENEFIPNPWLYLFSLEFFLEPWRLAQLGLIVGFVVLENRRSDIKNWWIFLVIGIVTSAHLALFAFLTYREHVLMNRKPQEHSSAQNAFNYLKIAQIMLGLGILYFIAHQIYYIIAFNHYWPYTFDPAPIVMLFELLFALPLIVYFAIEQSRQRIDYWWAAVPVYFFTNFILALPFFLWLKERSASKESEINQAHETES